MPNYEPIMGVPFSALVDHLVYLPIDVDDEGGWLFVTAAQGDLVMAHNSETVH